MIALLTTRQRVAWCAAGVVTTVAAVSVAGLAAAAAWRARQRTRTGTALSPPSAASATTSVAHVPPDEPLSTDEADKALQLLQTLKQEANTAFQQGRYDDALSRYQDCLDVVDALGASSATAVSTGQVIRANVVMTLIKQHEYASACHVATALLQDSVPALSGELLVKVLYRRGLASRALGHVDAALSDFRAAVQLSPQQRNAAAEKEMASLRTVVVVVVTMLLPAFTCSQDEAFVHVRIVLSALCKVTEAMFDISDRQFTFACRPYYLRLKFNESLTEDKGERATYDVERNTLTVYLPKYETGQTFTQLDNPAYLLATDKQRAQLIRVLSSDNNNSSNNNDNDNDNNDDKDDEVEETEYVQTLTSVTCDAARAPMVSYGFANLYTGLFAKLDADLVREVVAVPDPEHTTPAARRELRMQREQVDFDEDAVLVAFDDAEGEVARLLRYVPAHMHDLQRALRDDGVATAAAVASADRQDNGSSVTRSVDATALPPRDGDDAYEEEAVPLLPAREQQQQSPDTAVEVWCGNIGQFTRPPMPATTTTTATTAAPVVVVTASAAATTMTTTCEVSAATSTTPPPATTAATATRLAVPRQRPTLTLRDDERATLARLPLPRLLFAPDTTSVLALTAELLFAEAYDDVVTEGSGCSESLWNVCTLSAALTYLDPADTLYDACVQFARRVLVYPLHRHFALVQRAIACAGARMLLGRLYVVRALLRVRDILAHAEHRHLLATIFVDPLIGYWMNAPHADELLTRAACECHAHVARTHAEVTRMPAPGGNSDSGAVVALDGGSGGALRASTLLMQPSTRTLQPITLLTLGLPFRNDDDDEEEEVSDDAVRKV